MNSISRMPPGPELDVVLQLAPLDFPGDQAFMSRSDSNTLKSR